MTRTISPRIPLWSLLFLALVAQNTAAQNRDNELWLTETFSFGLSPKTRLDFRLEQRVNENVSNLLQAFVETGISFQARPWLNLVPGFRFVRHEPFKTEARFENRPQLDVLMHRRWSSWRAELRTRFEGRFIEGESGSLRIRVRPGIQYTLPVRKGNPPAILIDNDLFFDPQGGGYNRNRLRVGVSLPISSRLSWTPYYMVESNRLPALWDHDNIWGLVFSWRY